MSNDSTHVGNPLLRAALDYAERGWPVFPCRPGEKRPDTPHGCKDATTDAGQIRRWLIGQPNANVAIATGHELFVVDEDTGGAEAIAALDLPVTYTVRTPSGGRHFYFRLPHGVTLGNSTRKLGVGVDTRGTGGYVVAPPSQVNGTHYVVEVDAPLAELPALVIDVLRNPAGRKAAPAATLTAYGRSALEREVGRVATAQKGERNDRLNVAVHNLGQLVADGEIDEGKVCDSLARAARVAGLAPDEIEATIGSGLRAGMAKPRSKRSDEPWTSPTPLSDVPVPPFPVDVLPPVLARFGAELAKATQTPIDLPALVVLAVAACACARRIEVEVKEGYREPVNLYAMACLPSGSRKSAVFSDAVRPLQEAERERVERAMPAIAEAASARRILEGELREIEGRATKAPPEKRDALSAEAAELARRIAETPIPTPPRLLVDDVTSEALTMALEANGERLGLLSAEGGIFDIMAGRYSKNGAPNIDAYLKGHAGDRLRVDRATRPPTDLQRPALTIGLTVQPDVLRGVFAEQSFRGRGLCARFLYAVPQSNIGTRDVDAEQVSPAARAAYNRAIRGIVDTDWPAEPAIVQFSAGARAAFRRWQAEHERTLGQDGTLELLADWGSKLPGALARLAGIFHLVEGDSGELRAESIERSIALAPYLIAHAKAAHALMGADPAVESARAVLRHLERKQVAAFTRRDLFNALRSRFPKVNAIDAPLALLEAHGYLRPDGPLAPNPRGGRPPSTSYQVNPHLLAGGARGA